jgi:hypothetical protein
MCFLSKRKDAWCPQRYCVMKKWETEIKFYKRKKESLLGSRVSVPVSQYLSILILKFPN